MARFAQIRRTTVFQELNYSIISFCKWTLRDESVKWLASTELICFHWNGFSSGSVCAERITYWIKAQQPQEKSCFFKRDAATTNKSCTQCCNGYPFRETTVCVFQRNLIAMGCKVIGIFFFSLAQAIIQCSQSSFLFDLSLQLFPNDPVISCVE